MRSPYANETNYTTTNEGSSVYLVQADQRGMIGYHQATLEVQTEWGQKVKNLSFMIEILDCKVDSFVHGEQ